MTDPQQGRPHRPSDLMAPATQIVHSRADYLGEGQSDIGQRVADDRLELFVTGDPAQAVQQQFALLSPECIVLHDVGASHSLRLLWSIAKALGTKLQHLAIRRQGQGVALATLRFVDMPGKGKSRLRLYTTDVDADTHSRRQLANVLLGNSKLGVLMIGELPLHALNTALQPLRDAIRLGPWANRKLLLMPMGTAPPLTALAAELAQPRELDVGIGSAAPSPQEAWAAISAAWRGGSAPAPARVERRAHPRGSQAAAKPTIAGHAQPVAANGAAVIASGSTGLIAEPAAATASLPAAPRAATAQPAAAAAAVPASGTTPSAQSAQARWQAYLNKCTAMKGLISACVVDFRAERALAHVGGRPAPDKLADQAAMLFAVMAEASRALGLGHAQPDASITLTGHHLVLHPLPGHPGTLLFAVLDASVANLVLARMQLQRIDAEEFGIDAQRGR